MLMKTKEEIVNNWLPRYTGASLDQFGKYILLTNFSNYVNMFASWNGVEVIGKDRPMQCATADGMWLSRNFKTAGCDGLHEALRQENHVRACVRA